MSKIIILILLFGIISIKGFTQEKEIKDSVLTNSSIPDPMTLTKNVKFSTLKTGLISQDSLVNDTLKSKKEQYSPSNVFKAIKLHGTLSNGYEYGVSPSVLNNGVMGVYKSEGNIGIDVFSLPLNIRYYYSTYNVMGLNNYFSVSFDVNKYKENLKKKMSSYQEKCASQLDSLLLCRQNLVQKQAFFEWEAEAKIKRIEELNNVDYSKYKTIAQSSSKVMLDSVLNFSGKITPDFNVDTLVNKIQIPHNFDYNKLSDTLNDKLLLNKKQTNLDSLQGIVSDYQERSEQLRLQIQEVDSTIKIIQSTIQSLKGFNGQTRDAYDGKSLLSRFKGYLFDVKKIDVGLCYPSYSNFLIKGSAIKGVNVEFENNDYFVAFSHGTSVNTFVNPLNAVERNLNKFTQMFDFLDFNNQEQNRRLTSMMFGYGKKQSTHLHAGFLYGIGSANMFQNSQILGTVDKNYVLELDGRAIINKSSYFDFSYGKSSIQGQNETLESSERGFAGVFTPKRSNAAIVSLHTQMPIVKTKVQLSVRWLDPYFKSFGIGFLKSDNLKYEVKLDQRLSKKINVSCLIRKSEDNLLNLFDYKNKLNTFGLGANVKWTRRLSTKVNYNMIIQSMDVKQGISYNSKSYVSTYVLNYQIPKVKTIITAIYNDYNIADATTTNRFENVLFTGTTDIGKKVKNSFTVNTLKSNMKDSLSGNSAMISNELMFIHKKVLISVNGKYAFLEGNDNQLGYGIKATVSFYNTISLEGSFERIVYGSYYNYITVAQIEKFPYYCSIKLNYIWK